MQPQFLPQPARGRVFTSSRVIAGTDVNPAGRLRFDALVRYLQQVAEADVLDAGLRLPYGWLVRKYTITIREYPRHGEQVGLATFCSGTGPRWAGRTTTLTGAGGDALIQATGVWVAVTGHDGTPAPLGEEFGRVYGDAAAGRQVGVRLTHPGPPGELPGRDWPLRASDFDTAGHVNNAVHWAAVEDVLAGAGWLPTRAELEYARPILPGQAVRVATAEESGQLRMWLLNGPGQPLASACLAR